MPINPDHEVDVVIIGAGSSGLMSAYKLLLDSPMLKVIVLEAKERIGGRLMSHSLPTAKGYDDWDFGGQFVSTSQPHIMKALKDFGIEVYPQYNKGKGKLSRGLNDIRTFSSVADMAGTLEGLDFARMIKKIDSMVSQVPVGNPLQCKYVKEWDNQTVQTFIDNSSVKSSNTIALISLTIRLIFGVEPRQMSLIFFLYYCGLSGGFSRLISSDKEGAQEYRVEGTMFGFMKKLADKVGEKNIVCGAPVVTVEQLADASVIVTTLSNCSYRAKYVICAIPPHLVSKIHFIPSLPFNRQQLNQRMPIGNWMKCFAVYKRAFWRENGLSGQALMVSPKFDKTPLNATFDATTSNGSPAILAVISGEQSFYWSQKTKEERKEAVLDCLVALFGKEARSELVSYEDKDWSKEDYTGGCPVGIMQPGCMVYFEHALREPFDNIHWAGTETARQWMGYIDGAVEAGLRAAGEVIKRINQQGDKELKSKISTPSSIFDSEEAKASESSCEYAYIVVAGAVVCTAGYYLFKKYFN